MIILEEGMWFYTKSTGHLIEITGISDGNVTYYDHYDGVEQKQDRALFEADLDLEEEKTS